MGIAGRALGAVGLAGFFSGSKFLHDSDAASKAIPRTTSAEQRDEPTLSRLRDTFQREISQSNTRIFREPKRKIPRYNGTIVGEDSGRQRRLHGFLVRGERYEGYLPITFENYVVDFRVDNIPMELAFWNTGAEEYERLRPLSYPGSHVVLICFAAGSASERDEVRRKWVPEVRYHCHDTPIVLVGFGPEAGDILDSQQDLDLGKEIGAAAYVQFNAETGAGWSDALEAAARAASLFAVRDKISRQSKRLWPISLPSRPNSTAESRNKAHCP